MKKFRFSLETYLKLKELQENKKLGELSEVLGRVNEYRQGIEDNKASISAQNELFSGAVQPGSSIAGYAAHEAYIKRLYSENDRYHEKIEGEEENLQKARADYIQANKEKKILEILKEKQWQKYREQLLKMETLEVEEFNNSRTGKKRAAHESKQPAPLAVSDREDENIDELIERVDRAKSQYEQLRDIYDKQRK